MKIEIKGKEYGLHFGLGATEVASEVFGIDVNDVFFNSVLFDKENKEVGVSKEIVFGALLNWCEENDVKSEFKFTNFRNVYNEFTQDKHNAILEFYRKSRHNGKVVGDIFDELIASFPKLENEEQGNKKKVVRLKKLSKTAYDGGEPTTSE